MYVCNLGYVLYNPYQNVFLNLTMLFSCLEPIKLRVNDVGLIHLILIRCKVHVVLLRMIYVT